MKTPSLPLNEERATTPSQSKGSRNTRSARKRANARKRKLRATDLAEGVTRLDDRVLKFAVPHIRRFIAENRYAAPQRKRGRPKNPSDTALRSASIPALPKDPVMEIDQQSSAGTQQASLKVSASEKAAGHVNPQTTFFDEV
jgi:hypothetical protein